MSGHVVTHESRCFLQEKKNQNLPEQICASCINDLEASYRFKMNCESSDAILQTYMQPVNISEVYSEASENEDEIISESEAEIPVDESDLYNYQSQVKLSFSHRFSFSANLY